MPTLSDYLLLPQGGVVTVNVGTWVRLTNNLTSATFVSTAATDSAGKFTVNNVPAGDYSLATGPTAVGGWTTINTHYPVGDQSLRINVKDYGAAGDGSTNDSTAIQAAFDACNTLGGGTVYFPAGRYVFANVNFYRKIRYLGSGVENTILQLRTGSATNVPLLQSNQFTTLAAGGGGSGPGTSAGGEFNFSFDQMTLDGNKANVASTVPLFRMYGFGFTLSDSLVVRNSNNINLYSEWGASLPAPGPDSMEAHINGVKIHDAGSHGVLWQGPHDTNIVNIETYNNGGNGFRADGNGTGLKISNSHSWGLTQTYAWYFNAQGCQLISGVAEGASTAQIAINANDCQVSADNIFAAGGGTTGIIIGDTTTVTGTVIFTKVQNCTTAAINFKNDGGSFVQCLSFQTSGPAFIGTPHTATLALIQVQGGGTTPLLRMPTVLDVFGGRIAIHAGNPLRLFNNTDSSFAEFSFDGATVQGTWPLTLAANTFIKSGGAIIPGTPAGAQQAGQIFMGSGAPSNTNGNNGDVYHRTDTPGTVNQRMYVKSAGSWVGVV